MDLSSSEYLNADLFNQSISSYTQCLGKIKQAIKVLEESTLDTSAKRELNLLLITLRENNRTISLYQRQHKRQVQKIKSVIDEQELSRQGYLYEKNYLLASIADAQKHESLYLTISLPQRQQDEYENNSMFLEEDESQLMLSRLQTELEERRSLAERLKSSTENLDLAKSRLVLKRKELERLRDQVAFICKASDSLISSNCRLFEARQAALARNSMELDSDLAATTASVADVSGNASVRANPIETLVEALAQFAEKNDFIRLQVFEAEEDPEEGEFEDDAEKSDVDDAGSPDIVIKGHSRLSSHSTATQGRRFPFAHIKTDLLFPDSAEKPQCSIYFYSIPSLNPSLMLVSIIHEETEMSKGEVESFLLQLKLDNILLLTASHPQIVPGELGALPFRWLQAACGLIPDRSYSDVDSTLDSFFKAILDKIRAQGLMSPAATVEQLAPSRVGEDSNTMQVN